MKLYYWWWGELEGFGGHNGAIMGTGNGGCLETMVEAVKWF